MQLMHGVNYMGQNFDQQQRGYMGGGGMYGMRYPQYQTQFMGQLNYGVYRGNRMKGTGMANPVNVLMGARTKQSRNYLKNYDQSKATEARKFEKEVDKIVIDEQEKEVKQNAIKETKPEIVKTEEWEEIIIKEAAEEETSQPEQTREPEQTKPTEKLVQETAETPRFEESPKEPIEANEETTIEETAPVQLTVSEPGLVESILTGSTLTQETTEETREVARQPETRAAEQKTPVLIEAKSPLAVQDDPSSESSSSSPEEEDQSEDSREVVKERESVPGGARDKEELLRTLSSDYKKNSLF